MDRAAMHLLAVALACHPLKKACVVCVSRNNRQVRVSQLKGDHIERTAFPEPA